MLCVLRGKVVLKGVLKRDAVLLQEGAHLFAIAIGLCASRTQEREGCGGIAHGRAAIQRQVFQITLEKTSVEAITCADCVDWSDMKRGNHEALLARLDNAVAAAALYGDNRDAG